MAMDIQDAKAPRFDNVFINLRALFAVSTLKAIGKFNNSCVILDISIQSGVLAGRSANSFIDSKHLNRCGKFQPQIYN